MRIMTLAVGLATGYVLGARAGREKYNQIAAAAGKVSAFTRGPQGEPLVTGYKPDADSIATSTAAPSIEQPTPVVASETARRPRSRRAGASAKIAARNASDQTPSLSSADLGVDSSLAMESAEADFVEQNTPVVDNSEKSVLAPMPLESDAADVQEQRRSV